MPPYSYSWNFGNGDISDQQNPSETYTNPGTYAAVLTVTDGNGNQASSSMSVTVPPSVIYQITITDGIGGTIAYNITDKNGVTPQYMIDVPSGQTITQNVLQGATLNLWASPDAGFSFAGWTGSVFLCATSYVNLLNPLHFTPTRSGSIIANFAQISPVFVSIVSSANPAALGQSITFTASVSPSSDGGTVQFQDNGINLGSPVSVNTSGQAAYITSPLSPGIHVISAVYSGNTNDETSTATLTQFISLGIAPNPIPLPDAIGGSSYFQTLSALGVTGNCTWTIVGGTLPDGFTLNSEGVLSGQSVDAYASSSQQNTFTVQVTDSDNNATTESLVIPIDRPGWDVNNDGITNISDVVSIGLHWNTSTGDPNYISNCDVDGNGVVNINDVVIVGLHWNQTW